MGFLFCFIFKYLSYNLIKIFIEPGYGGIERFPYANIKSLHRRNKLDQAELMRPGLIRAKQLLGDLGRVGEGRRNHTAGIRVGS